MSQDPLQDRAARELDDALDDLDTLLKNNDVGALLHDRRVNVALALTVVAGLRAYLAGDRVAALEDLSTVVEEIASRGAASA